MKYLILLLLSCSLSAADYAVVIKKSNYDLPQWKKVADTLLAKYDSVLLQYEKSPQECLPSLKEHFPRYTCLVAPHQEATRKLVAEMHQLTRKLDNDPYTDTIWAILTGYDAANALSIASTSAPLTVKKVASGTDFAMDMVEQGKRYDELIKHKMVEKLKGEEPVQSKGPGDTTKALVDSLNDYKPDLFITSGHATERNWQIGFRYRNGYFVSKKGKMFGRDMQKKTFELNSPNPKVYLPIGNCLMGNINGEDSMALAWMNSCGVKQMMGYTVPTWYGYGGWGCLDYFVEQPGRYTFAEAFFANHQALLYRIETCFPKAGAVNPFALSRGLSKHDSKGTWYDRDTVALYGDPAWEAKMAERKKAFEQKLELKDGIWIFTITPNRGADSFKPVNTNGSQRGYRPILQMLPMRLGKIEILEGSDFKPLITDNFILVPNPKTVDPNKSYQIKFKAVEL